MHFRSIAGKTTARDRPIQIHLKSRWPFKEAQRPKLKSRDSRRPMISIKTAFSGKGTKFQTFDSLAGILKFGQNTYPCIYMGKDVNEKSFTEAL